MFYNIGIINSIKRWKAIIMLYFVSTQAHLIMFGLKLKFFGNNTNLASL